MQNWTPQVSTIVDVSYDNVLLESWSIGYALNFMEARGEWRYSRLMVFLRSVICVAQSLPASRCRGRTSVTFRFRETDGEPYDQVSPLPEEYCFPDVDMAQGKLKAQVRYGIHIVGIAPVLSESAPTKDTDSHEPSILEDYIESAKGLRHSEHQSKGDESRRWHRWASSSFDERERELSPQDEEEEETGSEEAISNPPENVRCSSNPMAIPGKSDHTSTRNKRAFEERGKDEPSRKGLESRSSPGRMIWRKSSSLRGKSSFHSRAPSGETTRISGYGVFDLVSLGTPILSSLPFAVESMVSSENSASDSTSLRMRFLTGSTDAATPCSSVPTTPPGIGSQIMHYPLQPMLEMDTHSFSSHNHTTPITISKHVYKAALPWVLTPAEAEHPFSGRTDSTTPALNDVPSSPATQEFRSGLVHEDMFALPFIADEETQGSAKNEFERQEELGVFIRRCQEAPDLFKELTTLEQLKNQLAIICDQSAVRDKNPEVLQVFEEPAI